MAKCANPLTLRVAGRFHLVDGQLTDLYEVPCGKCANCRANRKKTWSYRVMLESLMYKSSLFVTLTYDESYLPYTFDLSPTLLPDDLTKFFKLLRKNLKGRKIGYFACGEYGDRFGRPHYHAIIFGLDFSDAEVLSKSWKKGIVNVEDVTLGSIQYTCGYVQKKLQDTKDYGNVCPPFNRSSKHIGDRYLAIHWQEILKDGFIKFEGQSFPIPRYYWKKLEDSKFREERHINLSSLEVSNIKLKLQNQYLDSEKFRLEHLGIFGYKNQQEYLDKEAKQKNLDLNKKLSLKE